MLQNGRGSQPTDRNAGYINFREICGTSLEEYRRSVWYLTLRLEDLEEWKQIEQWLYPLVQQTMQNPTNSWSHARSILRLTASLLGQGKHQEARDLKSNLKTAYEKPGEPFTTLNRSILLEERSEVRTEQPMQIFVKAFGGRTFTNETQAHATVRSVIRQIHEITQMPSSSLRLINGAKQPVNDRYLSDYGIQRESTLHLDYRLFGGFLFVVHGFSFA
ncbi:MAG: hypothetical protein M1833_004560 [Piccolia ochrophora]|nr:MAG: hypothetical protein M1833_004560 [Piccolia ochrophora]